MQTGADQMISSMKFLHKQLKIARTAYRREIENSSMFFTRQYFLVEMIDIISRHEIPTPETLAKLADPITKFAIRMLGSLRLFSLYEADGSVFIVVGNLIDTIMRDEMDTGTGKLAGTGVANLLALYMFLHQESYKNNETAKRARIRIHHLVDVYSAFKIAF